MAEFLGRGDPEEPRSRDELIEIIPAVVVADSKNAYGAARKLAALGVTKDAMIGIDNQAFVERAAQRALELCWANGFAQLANSLTQGSEQRQLDLYYDIGHRWWNTYDEEFASGRKRAARGIGPLDVAKAKEKWGGCNCC